MAEDDVAAMNEDEVGADEIAHSFAYIRWDELERNFRLFKDGTVSYDRKARHGYWEYWWDAPTRRGHVRDPLQCQARESPEKARVQANRRDMRISM